MRRLNTPPVAIRERIYWAIAVLVSAVSIGACGESAASALRGSGIPKVGIHQAPEEVHGISVLAKGKLPGGGKFAIFVEPKANGGGASIRYWLVTGSAVPVRYVPSDISWPRRKGVVWDNLGSEVDTWRASKDAVTATMSVDGCIGPYPYRVEWLLLKAKRDTVTAYMDSRSIRFRTTILPRQLRAAGVVVYALLPWASGQVVTRAPDGRAVHKESLLGRSQEVDKCGG